MTRILLSCSLLAVLAGLAVPAEPKTQTDELGISFVRCAPGEFVRGLVNDRQLRGRHRFFSEVDVADERPAHRVKITKPFEIAAHEVTVGQFRKFVEATGYKTSAETGKGAAIYRPKEKNQVERWAPVTGASWKNPGFKQTDKHPIVCVSHKDAVAFCNWMTKKTGKKYRLPTEAEWEFACRAGTDSFYACGDDPDAVYAHGNVADAALEAAHKGETERQRADWKGKSDGVVYTAPVGSFKPNAWGIHDMHGNVWEWCADRYHDRYHDELVKAWLQKNPKKRRPDLKDLVALDPPGPKSSPQHKYGDWRSLRGGSWYVAPIGCRSAYRGYAEAGDAFSYTGFRVVRE